MKHIDIIYAEDIRDVKIFGIIYDAKCGEVRETLVSRYSDSEREWLAVRLESCAYNDVLRIHGQIGDYGRSRRVSPNASNRQIKKITKKFGLWA